MAADFAFLVMDLVRLGRPECARDLIATCRFAGGDAGDDALISFFAAYRAWVRATVACELADGPDAQARAEEEAPGLLALGHRLEAIDGERLEHFKSTLRLLSDGRNEAPHR